MVTMNSSPGGAGQQQRPSGPGSVAQCSSLLISTMWMLDSVIASENLLTTQRLVDNSAVTDEDRQTLKEDLHNISAWSVMLEQE